MRDAPAGRTGLALLGAVLITAALSACGGSSGTPRPGTTTHTGRTPTIPASLLKGMRPIGIGPRFRTTVTGQPTGTCRARPGAAEAHIELFAANRVLLIPGGVGISDTTPRCYGNAITTDPTGAIHFRDGATLQDVFRAWGEPFSPTRMASFTGNLRYYLDGRRVSGPPPLTQHAEIVIEVGPYVPPHDTYSFPRGL